MPVKQVSSDLEYSSALSGTKDKLVVVDFFATWCGPCKAVAHPYELLSEKYSKGSKFLKVDVDQLQSTSQSANVSAMPTFHVYRNQQLLGSVQGANLMELENIILQNYKEVEAFVGTGNKLGKNCSTSDQNPFNLLFQKYSTTETGSTQPELSLELDGEVEVAIRLWDKTIFKVKVLKSAKVLQLKQAISSLPNCPPQFELSSNFPKKVYSGELLERSIYQEGLDKNGQLVVQI